MDCEKGNKERVKVPKSWFLINYCRRTKTHTIYVCKAALRRKQFLSVIVLNAGNLIIKAKLARKEKGMIKSETEQSYC